MDGHHLVQEMEMGIRVVDVNRQGVFMKLYIYIHDFQLYIIVNCIYIYNCKYIYMGVFMKLYIYT